ncbi:MAG: glycosyltransferase [Pseudomonadota bacterium]
MRPARVFFYVQHLWGVGHVYRATRIARGMAKAGLDVHLVWGGTQIEGFDFTGVTVHYLPPVRTQDASFSQLLHANGEVFTRQDEQNRAEILLNLFKELSPQVVMTEAYPFGRRQMRFELLPLLEAIREAPNRPILVASIRDIMQEDRKEKRVAESNQLINENYDLVLVHGDQNMIRIEDTLQGAEGFIDKVRYTGLVTPDLPIEPIELQYESDVLVSVGGGAFGQDLTRTAFQAISHCKNFPYNWLLAAGTELSHKDYSHLKENCPDGMRIVRQIPDLVGAMKSARVSVSHAGYNTVADIMRAECASVLYPYTGGRETEQLRRAQIMAQAGIAEVVMPEALDAHSLAEAVDRASEMQLGEITYDLDGAYRTAEILLHEYDIASRAVD